MKRTAVLVFLIGVASAFGIYRCPAVVSRAAVFGTSCYEFVAVEATWVSAQARCHAAGGRLAYVGNREVQSWLSERAAQEFPHRQGVWLGLNDRTQEGTFVWDNYRTLAALKGSYFNWNAAEPDDHKMLLNQDCVYMRRSNHWQWGDIECDSWHRTYSSICEYEAIGLLWSSYAPFTSLLTLPAEIKYFSTTKFETDKAKDDTLPLTTRGYTRDTLPAQMRHISTTTYASYVTQDNEVTTAQEYVRAAAEPFLNLQTERLAASWTDMAHLKLLYVMGAVVLALIAGVVALVIWRLRRRTRVNSAAAVVLTTPVPNDTAAQPKKVDCPLEWQFSIKAENGALFDSSLKQKQVDEPSTSRPNSSGNIYVDIDALTCREPVPVNSLIIGQDDTEREFLSNSAADAEILALPPVPPPRPPSPPPSRLQVMAAVFNPANDLLTTTTANGKKSADVAVEIVGLPAIKAPIELEVFSGAAADRAAEGYLEFVSRGVPSETSAIPTV